MPNNKPQFIRRLSALAVAAAVTGAMATALPGAAIASPHFKHHHRFKPQVSSFKRIATFPVYLNEAIDTESVAEIVAASDDGNTLIYTDSANETVGYVDITDPANPQPLGRTPVGGEPTSVAVAGPYALVGVNTSPDFDHPSGFLHVIDIASQTIVATHDLNGQPDSVAVSPNKRWAAVAIENERDELQCVGGDEDGLDTMEDGDLEDLCEDGGGVVGGLPQLPAGNLKVVRLKGDPSAWSVNTVDLTGLADKGAEDPEPEYVAINPFNVAAVTLQENNHIVHVHLPSARVIKDYSAGEVDLEQIDRKEEDPALISLTDSQSEVPREPDGITWLNAFQVVTADEGDLDGGSRGVTVFDLRGKVQFTSGNSLDHAAVRAGHYPDSRSKNKGNETENVAYGKFGRDRYVFAASERSNVIFVYKMPSPWLTRRRPLELVQTLPAGVGPEGVLTLPKRNLLITAAENDARGDKYRAGLSIYQLSAGEASYPTIVSADRADGTPIPWAALSALAVDPSDDARAYTVYDSFYQQSRIFPIDLSEKPALIDGEIVLKDSADVLKGLAPIAYTEDDDGDFSNKSFDFANLLNADDTVNLDPEGLATRAAGGFWIASEGAGNLDNGESDAGDRPFTTPNLLLRVSTDGEIQEVVQLPATLAENQLRFGLEGVSAVEEDGKEILYVAFQRAWKKAGDPGDKARIGRYDTDSKSWSFVYYPLDTPTSPLGGWVGLSEIAHIHGDRFALVERDNQGGDDARIKRLTRVRLDPSDFSAVPSVTVAKSLVRDLIADGDLTAPNGAVIEKVEGLAVLSNGDAIINTDNDGVDDSNGETQMIRIPGLF